MKKISSTILGAACMLSSAPLLAQSAWVAGQEIVGQSASVTTNGVTNVIHFDANGAARIETPSGKMTPASWTAANQQLCLFTGAARECWDYRSPFETGQRLTLTSDCQATSQWLINGSNPVPVVRQERLGERG